jgi:hypothetical protein
MNKGKLKKYALKEGEDDKKKSNAPTQAELLDFAMQKALEKIKVNDNRKIHPVTGQPINPNRDLKTVNVSNAHVYNIIDAAYKQNINPFTALAIDLQETNYKSDPFASSMVDLDNPVDSNVGHALDEYDRSEEDTPYDIFAKSLRGKLNYANVDLKKSNKSEATILQGYNGYGKIGVNTEKFYHNQSGRNTNSFYGIDVTKEPLDLSKNPAFGKSVIDLREKVIKQTPEIVKMVTDMYPDYKQQYGDTLTTKEVKYKALGGSLNTTDMKYKSKLSKRVPKKEVGGTTYSNSAVDLSRYDYVDEGSQNQRKVEEGEAAAGYAGSAAMTLVNPLIAAGATASHELGKLVEDYGSKRNSAGKIADEGAFKWAQVGSAFLNPIGAIVKRASYKGGFGDLSGQGYLDYVNKDSYKKKAGVDEAALSAFNTSGKGADFFRAKGGMINPAYEVEKDEVILKQPGEKVHLEKGGQQLSSTAVEVGGDKHPDGGNNGKGGQFVISDQIPYGNGTVADVVNKANLLKGKGEKKLASATTKLGKDTANRMIANGNLVTAKAVQYQEDYKATHGMSDGNGEVVTAAKGGKIPSYDNGSSWADAVPYALEGINLALNATRADIPKPVYTKPVNLRTEYDITGGLQAINEGLGNVRRYDAANTSNSVNARLNNAATEVRGITAGNALYNEKVNQENSLHNINLLNTQAINEKNNDLTNQYTESKRLRKEAQLGETSASLGSMASTYSTQRRQKQEDANKVAYDDKVIKYMLERDKTNAFSMKNVDLVQPNDLQSEYTEAKALGQTDYMAKLKAKALLLGKTLN